MEIWLGDFSGHVRQITHDDAPDLFPVFTPDGKNLTYISGHTGNTDIYNLPLPSDWQKTGTSPIHPTIKPEKSK
jgi:Tol biopolymer transport system component